MSSSLTDPISSSQSLGLRTDNRFPDPFWDVASMNMPTSIQSALYWSEFLLQANGIYREAIRRIVSYFITDIDIVDMDDRKIGKAERDKYLDFLNDTLGIKKILNVVATDFLTYGNSFTSVLMPFRRYLSCKKCGFEAPLRKIANSGQFRFEWKNFDFHAGCPKCGYAGVWQHVDRRSNQAEDIEVKRWRPQEIDILYDDFTGKSTYIWKIADEYRAKLRQGKLHHIENASWEIIQAVKSNQNLMFDKNVIYHMKEDALAGLLPRGWGMSRVLTNFRQAYYVQVLQRYNEAIALDYVVPFRVLTPAPRTNGGGGSESTDPVHSINLSGFVNRVQQMLAARQRDPARWNVLPFPLEYNALGGEAAELAPRELIDQGQETLLTSIGIPVELFKGSLSVQSAPVALRLLEANWSQLVHHMNAFLSRLVRRVSELLGWDPVHARLTRVTHADDLNRQMAKLQLMMGNQISKTTGLNSVGLDYDAEVRRMLEEGRIESEEQQRMTEEMTQSAQMQEYVNAIAPDVQTQAMAALQGGQPGAAPAPGGAPAGPGGQPMPGMGPSAVDQFISQRQNNPNVPITPDELQAQAQTIAADLMAKTDYARRTDLAKLRKSDITMHQLVTSLLEQMRRDAASQGREQVLQQQYGKAASAPPPITQVIPRRSRYISLD